MAEHDPRIQEDGQPAPPQPVLHRGTRPLSVKLTDPELQRLGRDLAAVCDDIIAEEARTDSIKQELKARMTGLESKRTQLATLIRRGEEIRDVAVETRADYATGLVREIRLDTEELLSQRPLTEKERQPELLPETAAAAQSAEVVHSAAPEAETT